MKTILLIAAVATLSAQTPAPDRLLNALADRSLAQQLSRLKTDDRIGVYDELLKSKPENLHYPVLLASAYIQKMRETTDFTYLDRASKLLDAVVNADGNNYEALRLRSEIELERHEFARVAEDSLRLTKVAPDDPWNWGTLGDALIEMGDYDHAADAYQKMVSLRPDLSSYNRAAYYRFLVGDVDGAVSVMQKAIDAGSPSSENTAWCMVDLGNFYLKTGKFVDAERSYTTALRVFPGYHPAYAGLGKAQSAQGDRKAAIASFLRAQSITPLPDYAAALYDLYTAEGKTQEAQKQMDLVDLIDKMAQANNEKLNRNLAMIYADHDRKLDRALALAQAEMDVRKDIYSYDALAWALYKNKRYEEADKAMGNALKLGTPEPSFAHHARLIASALGKKPEVAEARETR